MNETIKKQMKLHKSCFIFATSALIFGHPAGYARVNNNPYF